MVEQHENLEDHDLKKFESQPEELEVETMLEVSTPPRDPWYGRTDLSFEGSIAGWWCVETDDPRRVAVYEVGDENFVVITS
jgi:hypothetical protein